MFLPDVCCILPKHVLWLLARLNRVRGKTNSFTKVMDIFKKCAMYLITEKKSSKKFAGEM